MKKRVRDSLFNLNCNSHPETRALSANSAAAAVVARRRRRGKSRYANLQFILLKRQIGLPDVNKCFLVRPPCAGTGRARAGVCRAYATRYKTGNKRRHIDVVLFA